MLRNFGLLPLLFGIVLALNCALLAGNIFVLPVKADEINSLERGQVVQKSLGQIRKGLKGTESKILINAPAKKVWDVVNNKENLPKFIRQIKSAQVLEDNNDKQKVATTIKLCELLPTFKYILAFDNSEKYRRIKFKKTGGAFKELFGSFEVIPHGNKTIFAYRIYSDPGFYIPEFISKKVRGDATNIMLSIKREAEK